MRAIYLLSGLLIAFLLGGYVDHAYDWPWATLDTSFGRAGHGGSSTSAVPLPSYSRAQGAEDPPRNDVPAGASTDMQRCISTMIQRREPEQEARQVCQKIITGIGG